MSRGRGQEAGVRGQEAASFAKATEAKGGGRVAPGRPDPRDLATPEAWGALLGARNDPDVHGEPKAPNPDTRSLRRPSASPGHWHSPTLARLWREAIPAKSGHRVKTLPAHGVERPGAALPPAPCLYLTMIVMPVGVGGPPAVTITPAKMAYLSPVNVRSISRSPSPSVVVSNVDSCML